MKTRIQKGHLSAWGCLLFALLVALPCGAECTLSMGWEDWTPYQFKSSDGNITGLDIELISAIAAGMNCKLTLKELPWKRHLMDIEAGTTDLAAGASKNPEREAYALFTEPYRTESVVLYVRKGEYAKYPLNSFLDMAKTSFRLGISRGYEYGPEFAQLTGTDFKKQIQEVSSDSKNYPKLVNNRIDGFLGDPFATTAGLRNEGLLDKVEIHPVRIYSADIFVMFSKKSTGPEKVKAFNESLQKLKAEGTYEAIMNKYLQ